MVEPSAGCASEDRCVDSSAGAAGLRGAAVAAADATGPGRTPYTRLRAQGHHDTVYGRVSSVSVVVPGPTTTTPLS
jgi:hypothetical protein